MTDGLWRRTVDRLQDKVPGLHRFLTEDKYSTVRGFLSIAGFILLGALLLWGLTGQSFGEAPVVVIESESMMHCLDGPSTGDRCDMETFGGVGTIDTGDLIFVRDTDGADTITTFAEDGRDRYGAPGDVIIYDKGGGTPIIHRAMFWIELHGDGTYSIPALDIDHSRDLDHPALASQEARDRFGLAPSCQLFDGHTRGSILRTPGGGFVTKGDNNACWDQSPATTVYSLPVVPEQIIGKARGEVPWIGLLKLLVFDLLGGTDNYGSNAPAQLKTLMWVSVGALVLVPYGAEVLLKRRGAEEDDPSPPGSEEE